MSSVPKSLSINLLDCIWSLTAKILVLLTASPNIQINHYWMFSWLQTFEHLTRLRTLHFWSDVQLKIHIRLTSTNRFRRNHVGCSKSSHEGENKPVRSWCYCQAWINGYDWWRVTQRKTFTKSNLRVIINKIPNQSEPATNSCSAVCPQGVDETGRKDG